MFDKSKSFHAVFLKYYFKLAMQWHHWLCKPKSSKPSSLLEREERKKLNTISVFPLSLCTYIFIQLVVSYSLFVQVEIVFMKHLCHKNEEMLLDSSPSRYYYLCLAWVMGTKKDWQIRKNWIWTHSQESRDFRWR